MKNPKPRSCGSQTSDAYYKGLINSLFSFLFFFNLREKFEISSYVLLDQIRTKGIHLGQDTNKSKG